MAWLLAILIAYQPVAAQQTAPPPPPVNVNIATPVYVDTTTQVVANVQTTQIVSPGSVNLTNVSIKPVPPDSTIQISAAFGTNGNCQTPIPAIMIIQDCTLGATSFESDMVNGWLALHGRPASDAALVYQYGGSELRSDIRSWMWQYIKNVIQEDPSLRTTSDQAVFKWIEAAVQKNEIAYYKALTNEYNSWSQSPCTYVVNAIVAQSFNITYNGEAYCGASIAATYTPPKAPDVSYFEEVGELMGYDMNISAYDGASPNHKGTIILYQTEGGNPTWGSLAGLGPTIAVGAIVKNAINYVKPFANRRYLDVKAEENAPQQTGQTQAQETNAGETESEQLSETEAEIGEEEAELSEAENAIEIGEGTLDAAGAAGIVLIFVEIAIQASIDFYQTLQNQDSINSDIATGQTVATTPPDLNKKLGDSNGYQQVFETFTAATLPDITQKQGAAAASSSVAALRPRPASIQAQAAPAPPPIPPSTPANDVVYIIDKTHNTTYVSNGFNYVTWDPAYLPFPGNPPYPQYGTSITAYPYEFGFVQTITTGVTNNTFFSTAIRYIDPNTGIRYLAELIDKGRFLVTKAPDQITHQDFDCPGNPVFGLTQSPGTQIPQQCKSFVTNTLNIWDVRGDNTTVQLPQPPVFATPNAADFSIAAENYFVPLLDSTTQGLPCSIRTTGTLPPGYAFQNDALFLQIPSQVVPGSYQFNFVADCETLGLGTPFVNYSFGTSITTQPFTAKVYAGAVPGASVAASSTRPSSLASKVVAASANAAASTGSGLQFIFPTSSTSLTFTQGRSTTMNVLTNGGKGTTITAGANALPPGMTLTDHGNGTATVSGIPTIPAKSCSSNCAITASAPGFASASLTLNDTVAPPVLPTIPTAQSVAWNAAEINKATIDGSADSNNKPTNVPLSWSVVGALPYWASFTDNKDNIATLEGVPPVSAAGQTIPIQFRYSYGGTPGFTSQTFTLNVAVKPPAPVLRVSPSLLFEVGVLGSGTINSSTFIGVAGLSGSWKVNTPLPTGLTASSSATSLTISGKPENPGGLRIPIRFTDTAGTTVTRNVAMMITQPASLDNFPSRLVLFVGVPANFILPVRGGFPRDKAVSPGDGLPSTTGTNLALTGDYSTTNGFNVLSHGGGLVFGGTPLAPATYPLTVSAQTVLSTGPVGAKVSQPFTLYVAAAGDVNLDGEVNCADYDLIKAHFGATIGAPNYLDLADPNRDEVVNILDLAFVQSHLPKGTVCH